MSARTLLWCVGLLLIGGSAATAATIRVPDDEPTIQIGIDVAAVGDTVLVACGTYHESDIRIESGVHVVSEGGTADCATIDAGGNGTAITFWVSSELATLRGFTVTGGDDPLAGGILCYQSVVRIENVSFVGNVSGYSGGGLRVVESDAVIMGTSFTGNSADHIGGGLSAASSSIVLADSEFSGNTASEFGGGGAYVYGGDLQVSGVRFIDNSADRGGGLYCSVDLPVFSEVRFEGNSAGSGGGLYLTCSMAELDVVTLTGNSARGQGGGAHVRGDVTFRNATFAHNEGWWLGAGLFVWQGATVLEQSIVAFSSGAPGVSCHPEWGVSATLVCCDVFGNEGGDWVGCVTSQLGLNGNLCADPMFCGDATPETPVELQSGSPCLAANNGCSLLIGSQPAGCETSVESATWGSIKALFREGGIRPPN